MIREMNGWKIVYDEGVLTSLSRSLSDENKIRYYYNEKITPILKGSKLFSLLIIKTP